MKSNNVLIAEFMGYEPEKLMVGKYSGRIVYPVKRKYSGLHIAYDYVGESITEFYFASELKYNKLRSWISKVVEKINSMGGNVGKGTVAYQFRKSVLFIKNLED